jgi:decaprenyl-phosphate phosphoribosyltransferase
MRISKEIDSTTASTQRARTRCPPVLRGYIEIARINYWFKNVFVLPGIVAALSLDPHPPEAGLMWRICMGFVSICLIASSNYVINEIMDAPFDRWHPTKSRRPVVSGRVNNKLAYLEWILLMVIGLTVAFTVGTPFFFTMLVLWIMGCIYNLPPLRSKDLPYVDVLTEAINNPIRMLAGWFMVNPATLAPASLLVSYWMIGCYFMGMKRFAEYREFTTVELATAYRRSFKYYTQQRLLISLMFYGAAATLFFGAFIARYRLEMVLAFPLIALIMAVYLALAFEKNSAVQRPEKLYREPFLMFLVVGCSVLMTLLLFVDIPLLYKYFGSTGNVRGADWSFDLFGS